MPSAHSFTCALSSFSRCSTQQRGSYSSAGRIFSQTRRKVLRLKEGVGESAPRRRPQRARLRPGAAQPEPPGPFAATWRPRPWAQPETPTCGTRGPAAPPARGRPQDTLRPGDRLGPGPKRWVALSSKASSKNELILSFFLRVRKKNILATFSH